MQFVQTVRQHGRDIFMLYGVLRRHIVLSPSESQLAAPAVMQNYILGTKQQTELQEKVNESYRVQQHRALLPAVYLLSTHLRF